MTCRRMSQPELLGSRPSTCIFSAATFSSEFCTDHGLAINNADLPPLVEPTKQEEERIRDAPPAWLPTVPAGLRKVYDYWKTHMKPGGFKFSMRIIDYRDGRPGNVGTFISW